MTSASGTIPPAAVVLDARFVIGLCAKEPGKYPKALAAIQQRVQEGSSFHAPHLLVMECAYVLCNKLQTGSLTPAEHAAALANLQSVFSLIEFPPDGDSALLAPAEVIRQSYGCSRSADSFYIALASCLLAAGPAELLTFDAGQQSHASNSASSLHVTVLTPDP